MAILYHDNSYRASSSSHGAQHVVVRDIMAAVHCCIRPVTGVKEAPLMAYSQHTQYAHAFEQRTRPLAEAHEITIHITKKRARRGLL